jgi:hypothetical protein
MIVGGAVILGVIAFFAMRDDTAQPKDTGASTGAEAAPQSPGSTNSASVAKEAPTAPVATGNPAVDFKARHASLAAGDLAGRLALVEFCREHDLADQRLLVLREVLLLDAENEVARKSLGFTKHATAGSPFEGRWLTKTEGELASAYDALIAK